MFHRRLYFLLADEPQAIQVVADIESARIERQHIHAIAGRGATLTQLPQATEPQRRDAARRLERVAWLGNLALFALALIGLIVSLVWDARTGQVLSATVMALTFVAGALFAMRVPDTHLDEFHGALSHSEVLLMVDVPASRMAEIEKLVGRRHPEAIPGGTSWTIEAWGL